MNHREWFDTLTLAQIESFPVNQQEESLYLEFKTTESADFSKRNDKKIFAEVVSGFANAEGGVVVWGVDSRPNDDGLDCAIGLKPIRNVDLFVARLKEITGSSASPPVAGIEHKAIARPDGSGFAATLILESEAGPHMGKLGEDRYFRRHGTSFLRMEHYELADMFGRRPHPRVVLTHRITQAGVILGLTNEGRGSARAPFLAFDCNGPFHRSEYGLDGNRNEGMQRIRHFDSDLPNRYGEPTSFVIHPGVTREVTLLWLGLGSNTRQAPSEDLRIRYAVCAEDQPLQHAELVIPLKDLPGAL